MACLIHFEDTREDNSKRSVLSSPLCDRINQITIILRGAQTKPQKGDRQGSKEQTDPNPGLQNDLPVDGLIIFQNRGEEDQSTHE